MRVRGDLHTNTLLPLTPVRQLSVFGITQASLVNCRCQIIILASRFAQIDVCGDLQY